MKNATEYKSGTLPTLASLGSFTISPYHLNKVLSAGEFHLLETLRYLTERNTLKRKPVSYSLLLVESRFT